MPRITGKEAEGLMAAYAKVHAPKEEKVAIEEPVIQKTPTEDIQERVSSIRQRLANKAQTQANLKKATAGYNFSGTRDSSGSLSSLRADPVNNNNNNTATSKGGVERTVTKDSGGGINIQKGKDLDAQTDDLIANTPTVKNSKFGSKKLEKSTLNKSTLNNVSGNPKAQDLLNRNPDTPPKKQDLLNRNPDNPPSGTPVNQLFGKGGSDGSPAPYTGGPNAAQRANAGTQKPQQQQTGTQGTQQPVKTVGGQGNRQRAVKTGGIQLGKSIRGGLRGLGNLAGRVAGGIKQGVQSAASGIKQGAQAVAGALQNKGPIQGRLSGPQRRAQQTQQKPVPQAKPAPQAQAAPQAKPVAQKLTPAQQAQKMAKDRIAAGRNTVTGELKSKPKVRKITSVMDMEGYDLIDDTVNFLISEGYVANESDALSIMSEPEFREGFDEGIQQVLNESSENNK
tara:strand:- start:72 stop:1424 length:1353 start_codon:yes stop_codon:yes gene_type:complete